MAVVVVGVGLVEMVVEWLPLFLGIGLEAGVEKMRILLFVLKKSRFFLQISLQEPWVCFWGGEEYILVKGDEI